MSANAATAYNAFFFPQHRLQAFPLLEKEQERDWKEVNLRNWKALELRGMLTVRM